MYKISKQGNRKLGNVININIPPMVACRADLQCRKYCYCNKGTFLYPNVKNRYNENYNSYLVDGWLKTAYSIVDQIEKSNIELVRWHASGEIVDSNYFKMVVSVAESLPQNRFMIFTKKYNIVNEWIDNNKLLPVNLTVVFSQDENVILENKHNLPIAIVSDETTTCGSQLNNLTCANCKKCWNVSSGQTVIFKKH